MFHEMLFGEIYFIGNSQHEVSMKILNKPYVLRADQVCSPEVRDVLMRMIEKDRTKRITGV
jgi:calcium-dependent protein kinase